MTATPFIHSNLDSCFIHVVPSFHSRSSMSFISSAIVRYEGSGPEFYDADPCTRHQQFFSAWPNPVLKCEHVCLTWMVDLPSSLITGLLIDSERIYTQVANTFLASHGTGPLPAEIKAQLMGTIFKLLT